MNCPICKKNLKENGFQARQDGITKWFEIEVMMDKNKKKFLKYDEIDEEVWDNPMYFHCASCGEELEDLNEDKVIKILS